MRSWSYRGAGDLRLMQDLTSRLWPTSFFTAGGLAWQLRWETDEADFPVQLWGSDQHLAAWAFHTYGTLSALVDPDEPEIAHEVARWAVDAGAKEADVPDAHTATLDALAAHGFAEPDDAPFSLDMRRDVGDVPSLELADGYTVRSVTADDIDGRVDVHRAAWEPSSFTRELYEATRANWPYREDLDIVAVAPDGSFGACCIAWLDPTTGCAEIEPVGTHPDHRRRNLASAICLEAVRRVGELGGTQIAVHPRGDDAYPVPRQVYASIGFRTVGRTCLYVRSDVAA